jgi:hypothetical protein
MNPTDRSVFRTIETGLSVETEDADLVPLPVLTRQASPIKVVVDLRRRAQTGPKLDRIREGYEAAEDPA